MSHSPYLMRISPLIVDKLGVKLYDRVSAAVAELAANAYDADAENVRVSVPTASLLQDEGEFDQLVVEDDGHGMTPEEVVKYYLEVGRDRRMDKTVAGGLSRKKKRPVMGRKGIGKLAPFGICKRIEVWSAGGDNTPNGYNVSHFTMSFDEIMSNEDGPVEFQPGHEDDTFSATRGTRITLSRFTRKRVPDRETLLRQLSSRFAVRTADFTITLNDVRHGGSYEIPQFKVPMIDETIIDLSTRPVSLEEGVERQVTTPVRESRSEYAGVPDSSRVPGVVRVGSGSARVGSNACACDDRRSRSACFHRDAWAKSDESANREPENAFDVRIR